VRAPAADRQVEGGTVSEPEWLIDETQLPDRAELAQAASALRAGRRKRPSLAVRVNDVVVHDTKKWFSGADIRLDTIVVRGLAEEDNPAQQFYQPGTFRFPGVHDGDRLPIDAPGLLIFYGQPSHFLDISILVSRDRRDSDDLGDLIATQFNSSAWKAAAGSLLGLAVAAPQVAAITAALGGAAVVANLAADVLRSVTGDTIGLYRVSWLQHRDRFGLGRHPEQDVYRQRDLSFWYEIILDRQPRRISG
jgi:hypothetical protein